MARFRGEQKLFFDAKNNLGERPIMGVLSRSSHARKPLILNVPVALSIARTSLAMTGERGGANLAARLATTFRTTTRFPARLPSAPIIPSSFWRAVSAGAAAF